MEFILYIHIFKQVEEKFWSPYIKFMEENLQHYPNIFCLIGPRKPKKEIGNTSKVIHINKIDDFSYLEMLMTKSSKIFLHGLWFEFVCRIINDKELGAKTYWIPWGGDFYYKSNLSHECISCMKKIGHIITPVSYDIAYLRKVYNCVAEPIKIFRYPNMFHRPDLICENNGNRYINTWVVGNSAYPSNNHQKAFKFLAPFRDSINVYAPLSYGSRRYANLVVAAGRKIFRKNFSFSYKFYNLESYSKILARTKGGVMMHQRQQALGNCALLLGLGKTLYLKKMSPNWQHLKEIGFVVRDDSSRQLEVITDKERHHNIQLSAELFNPKKFKEDWEDIFSQ